MTTSKIPEDFTCKRCGTVFFQESQRVIHFPPSIPDWEGITPIQPPAEVYCRPCFHEINKPKRTMTTQGMLTKFYINNLVILKSGGPVMQIIGHSPHGRIWCCWEDVDGYIQEASFQPEMLTHPNYFGQPLDAEENKS